MQTILSCAFYPNILRLMAEIAVKGLVMIQWNIISVCEQKSQKLQFVSEFVGTSKEANFL